MAHFCNFPGGEIISGNVIKVAKSSITIGLWGYLDFQDQELEVVTDSPGVKAERKGITMNRREWLITTNMTGSVMVKAKTRDGAVWDTIDVTFMSLLSITKTGSTVRPEDINAVIAAVHSGRIQGASGQFNAIEKNGYFEDQQHQMVLADSLFPVLASLSRMGTISIMSMMRFGEGPHGKVYGYDAAVCSAIDISAYAGCPINLINGDNVENAINGIAKVISNLPTGSYKFGLTRPSPYAKGPTMPDKDVFLPCNDKNWPMYKPGIPFSNPTPQFVNQQARDTINAALMQNPRVSVNCMFQDGPDHLHLEAISASSS
jgi:hypothetical protein